VCYSIKSLGVSLMDTVKGITKKNESNEKNRADLHLRVQHAPASVGIRIMLQLGYKFRKINVVTLFGLKYKYINLILSRYICIYPPLSKKKLSHQIES
jgi:hypothetical protein